MKKIAIGIIGSVSALLVLAAPVFAQGGFTWPKDRVPFTDLGELLANILTLLFFFAAILAFLFIVIGGIQWITAGGDKIAAQNARDRITAAVVGLVIVVAAFAITWIVLALLGINIFGGVDFSSINPTSIFKPPPPATP